METKTEEKTEKPDKTEKTEKSGVDEKGVPWENRAKESERKLAEAMKRLEDLEASKTERTDTRVGESELTQEELRRLVQNPRKYISDLYAEENFRRETPKALEWLKSQEGYEDGDLKLVQQTISEYGISDASAMKRAEAAWKIVSRAKLEKQLASLKADGQREREASAGRTEGKGKSETKTTTLKRSDLIKQLAEAQRKSDMNETVKIIDLLEDHRE